MTKPFSPSCERNQQPIFEKLEGLFATTQQVLELGSGTGQHAAFFATRMSHLNWIPGDLEENHPAITQWTSGIKNVGTPIKFDLLQPAWDTNIMNYLNTNPTAIFTANTFHIVEWQCVVNFFSGLERLGDKISTLAIYGPFNYDGKFSSDSNRQFESWLKDRDHKMGIRDFEAITTLANKAGLHLHDDFSMPANNRLLVFQRTVS